MSRRAGQPDTAADIALRACVLSAPPTSFVMIAGAGSGKTTSLIKGLRLIIQERGRFLKQKRQRIACITYTEVAANEIKSDVGDDQLVHVSTIHSFLWSVICTFHSDIRQWVAERIDQKLEQLQTEAKTFSSRVGTRTREKNARDVDRYLQLQAEIGNVERFTYGVGSDYGNGILGHDDILNLVPELIMQRPLLRGLIAQQFPFVFVDECQDTFPAVVEALKEVREQFGAHFCLGFFGDPMQQIYPTGVGAIQLEGRRQTITKPENFRSTLPVLNVANAIRKPVGDLQQVSGGSNKELGSDDRKSGSAHIFVLPIDNQRHIRIAQVQNWMAQETADSVWLSTTNTDALRVLVIVHRMAATRLGFGNLYSALNDRAPESFKSGLTDGTAWPVRPFLTVAMPMVEALRAGQDFEVIQLLREYSPLLRLDRLRRADVSALLTSLHHSVEQLGDVLQSTSLATVRQVLSHLYEHGLIEADPRIASHLELVESTVNSTEAAEGDEDDEKDKEIRAMEAFLNCRASELWPYRTYISKESPYSTHHGVKGAEFDRVMVVLDDDEGKFSLFSYDRYFGTRALTANDRTKISQGEETVVDRTRRLFYVCCTRARNDLAVVYFAPDPSAAVELLKSSNLFAEDAVHDLASMNVH